MAGRHRAPSSSWRWPAAWGAVAAGLLVFTVWLTSGLPHGSETDGAALALSDRAPETRRPATPTPQTTASPSTRATPSSTSSRHATTTPSASTHHSGATTAPESTTTPPPTLPATSSERTPAETPGTASAAPASCSTELDGTQPQVAQVGHHILARFAINAVGGRADRVGGGDHPLGLALDFMVSPATGDALAQYVLAHQADFGVAYVIWQQRYNDGSGWSLMEDRGSPTANHMDHVHVSFQSGAAVSVTC